MELTGILWVKGPDRNWYLKCDELYIPLDIEAIGNNKRFGWEANDQVTKPYRKVLMSLLNKQDALIHRAVTRPKEDLPFTPTCYTCDHMRPLCNNGIEIYVCRLGQGDGFSDYHALADYLESQGKDPEVYMAGLCPDYRNMVAMVKEESLHREVFGCEDIPPLSSKNWGGHTQPKVYVTYMKRARWPKKTAAAMMLAIAMLCAIVVGVNRETTPTHVRPEVKEGAIR